MFDSSDREKCIGKRELWDRSAHVAAIWVFGLVNYGTAFLDDDGTTGHNTSVASGCNV